MTTQHAMGSTIGILGGGQLGRMLSVAASRLGLTCHIFDPSANPPAKAVAHSHMQAAYDDLNAAHDFASHCDIITYEFENIPTELAETLAKTKPLYPNAEALNTAQDRLTEKTFIRDQAGVPVADFREVNSIFDLKRATRALGYPCVLKTRRFGYDGKGQVIIRTEEDIDTAWAALKDAPSILEAFIPFRREVSVICARSTTGEMAAYPLVENVHKNHILHTSLAPAPNDNPDARDHALKILESLNYVGVLAVEFFELEDGTLLVNEIAPRVHNSGHWTQDAGCVDQFELHIRAICGWPLGDTTPRHTVQMTNLLGDDILACENVAKETKAFIHLYGKAESRAGRKMGHVNRIIS